MVSRGERGLRRVRGRVAVRVAVSVGGRAVCAGRGLRHDRTPAPRAMTTLEFVDVVNAGLAAHAFELVGQIAREEIAETPADGHARAECR